MALNLIMLGPPGAGKGTQAAQVARARGIPTISTGDILREAVSKGTELGKRAAAVMVKGELVSDDVVIGIVKERLDRPDVKNGFILDGFPRTVAQAKALDEIVKTRDPMIIIDIVAPDAELVRRLTSRMVCEKCGTNVDPKDAKTAVACKKCGGRLVQRSDDNTATVLERLKVYHSQTKPLVDFYQMRPTFRSVNGSQGPDQVAADLVAAIDSAMGGGKEARL